MCHGIIICRNKRNENKFIKVKRTACGHYYMKPYMCFKNESTTIINYLGSKRGRYFRINKKSVMEILEDYEFYAFENWK